jgi:O-antigen ligase
VPLVRSDISRLDPALAVTAALMLAAASVSIAVTQISLGLGLVLVVVRALTGAERPPRLGLERPALALMLWAALMIPLSTDAGQSLVNYKRFYLLAAAWVTATAAADERRRAWLMGALLLGAAAVAAVAVVQALLADGSLVARRMRLAANPMTSGSLMMITSLVALGGVLQPGLTPKARGLLAAAGVLCLLGLVMTMTRSTWLGFALGALVVISAARRRLLAAAAAAVVLLAVVLLLAPAELRPGALKRMSLDEVSGGRNTEMRVAMWRGGLRMTADRPLGFGDRDLRALGPEYYPNEKGVYHGHLHSDAVQLLVIWGWPGLGLAAWFIGAQAVLVRRRLRVLRRRPAGELAWARAWTAGALGAWAALIAAGLTEWYFGDAETQTMHLAVMGIALAAGLERNDD